MRLFMLFIRLLVFADFTSASSIAHENVSSCSESSICAGEYSDLEQSSQGHDCDCHSHLGHSHLSLSNENSSEMLKKSYDGNSVSDNNLNQKPKNYISQSIKPPIS